MSRSVSTIAVAILLFLAFLATFTSAAPADVERRHRQPDSTPSTDSTNTTDLTNTNNTTDTTNTTNTTQVDDGTNNVSGDVNTTPTSTNSGQATWYNTGLGACGQYDTDNEYIVALSEANWDGGAHCGQAIEITNPANGKSCSAIIRDMCPGCSYDSLDLSPAVFQYLDLDLGNGVFHIIWYYLSGSSR